ncbi:MAG: DNA mismatch repair protein MutL, partial [Chloroflexi bacterium]|nr:DNA mismatch repair protein MutL [Chloroflexota bacterium]
DLDSIATLGFRGEALPSIAAVSHVALLTRTAQEPGGVLVEVEDGNVVRNVPQGSPTGTSVAVSRLFQKTPARLKFLRSPSAESNRVQAVLQQLALAFPQVRFRLEVDGRVALTTSGSGELREVCSAIYGPATARPLLEVHDSVAEGESESAIGVDGLVSPPDTTRASRNYIHLLVNRRWVQSRTLAYAIEEAYQGFLLERRHPIAVIHLTVPLQEVDVNVHPAKLEVRFRREREVFAALQRAVRGALVSQAPVPTVRSTLMAPRLSPAPSSLRLQGQTSRRALSLFAPEALPERAATPRGAVSLLRVLGQAQNVYIVAEGREGVYLVDQHAAHERVLYERVRKEFEERSPQVQGLLEPVMVEAPLHLEEALMDHWEEWARSGFDLEHFGQHSYLLRAVPAHLRDADPGSAFLSVLEDVEGDKRGGAEWQDRLASSVACHSAVRAGDTLTHEAMTGLLAQLEAADQPHTCPHGRPTMVHISAAHLEREFGRR